MCMHMFMYMGIYGRTVHAQQHAYILLGVVHTALYKIHDMGMYSCQLSITCTH